MIYCYITYYNALLLFNYRLKSYYMVKLSKYEYISTRITSYIINLEVASPRILGWKLRFIVIDVLVVRHFIAIFRCFALEFYPQICFKIRPALVLHDFPILIKKIATITRFFCLRIKNINIQTMNKIDCFECLIGNIWILTRFSKLYDVFQCFFESNLPPHVQKIILYREILRKNYSYHFINRQTPHKNRSLKHTKWWFIARGPIFTLSCSIIRNQKAYRRLNYQNIHSLVLKLYLR